MIFEDWRDVHIGFESDGFKINGIEIWKHKWRRVGKETLQLPHPAYPNQRHSFEIYEVGESGISVRFAAGELSNGVWGFFVPA